MVTLPAIQKNKLKEYRYFQILSSSNKITNKATLTFSYWTLKRYLNYETFTLVQIQQFVTGLFHYPKIFLDSIGEDFKL